MDLLKHQITPDLSVTAGLDADGNPFATLTVNAKDEMLTVINRLENDLPDNLKPLVEIVKQFLGTPAPAPAP